MAYLVRPWTYRYILDDKRVPKGTPGAKRVKERARKWYGAGIAGLPKGKKVPLARDKRAALQMLADLEKRIERGEVGLQDSTTEAREIALEDHLQDFEKSLRNKPRPTGEEQIKLVMARIRSVFSGCAFKYPGDIRTEPILEYVAQRRRLPKEEGGISTQTANFYVSAVKQFCRWMCSRKVKRMTDNPLEEIDYGDVSLDRQHERRDLKPSEMLRLFEAAKASSKRFKGIAGSDRYMIYYTACGTGFRSAEIGTLTPESFNLDVIPLVAMLSGRRTKNRKFVTQPLPSGLASELREYLKAKCPGEKVWPGLWCVRAADMLKIDLEAAGIPYVVPGPGGPLHADFHALRHTYVTMIQENATPKTAQELARHIDPRLTIGRYSHSDITKMAATVNQIPLPGNDAAPELPSAEELARMVVLLATLLESFLVVALVVADSAADRDREKQSEQQTKQQNRRQSRSLAS
jgi:integrase